VCVCVCVCVSIYIYICIYTDIYIHTDIYIYIYIHTYIHTFIHTFIHTYVYTYIYIHTYIHRRAVFIVKGDWLTECQRLKKRLPEKGFTFAEPALPTPPPSQPAGTHFTRFTGAKVQILPEKGFTFSEPTTQNPLTHSARRYSFCLIYWYKSTNTNPLPRLPHPPSPQVLSLHALLAQKYKY
jgi:hypothetical protein